MGTYRTHVMDLCKVITDFCKVLAVLAGFCRGFVLVNLNTNEFGLVHFMSCNMVLQPASSGREALQLVLADRTSGPESSEGSIMAVSAGAH